MASLSIDKAWDETTAFLGREAGLLAPVALLLIAIPAIAALLIFPPQPEGVVLGWTDIGSGAWIADLLVLLAYLVAVLAITCLALRPGSSVGEALQRALRRLGPMLLSSVLITVALALPLLVILLAAGVRPDSGGMLAPESASLGTVSAMTLIVIALLIVMPRLLLMTPVAAAEPGGAIGIMTRSWTLTRGHYWRLLGLILLVGLVTMIILMAVSYATGILTTLIAGPGSAPFVVSGVVSILFETFFGVVFWTFVARVYAQLVPAPDATRRA